MIISKVVFQKSNCSNEGDECQFLKHISSPKPLQEKLKIIHFQNVFGKEGVSQMNMLT